jgi:hypothetical protein
MIDSTNSLLELAKAHDEYIKYLIKEYEKLSWVYITRPQYQLSKETFEEGERIRAIIKQLKKDSGVNF